jgi:hypothetical protein
VHSGSILTVEAEKIAPVRIAERAEQNLSKAKLICVIDGQVESAGER